ncbi:hypothetical protein [Tabrizicola sp.]|uniref:hypothetical protein n=1 Tax=Tabrizicola sp. TaxID=2005166 RepID=UPI00286A21E3|nr:hypothetical protein [Tabrizicola sp.]
MRNLILGLVFLPLAATAEPAFRATGPTEPTRLSPDAFLGAGTVTFADRPWSLSFDLPWQYCAVTENGIKVCDFAAETYDPRTWDKSGAGASFEPGMDKEGRYVRAWVDHASPARIVVGLQYALNNEAYDIAHADIPSGSPHGDGDWGEERWYIYPDGTYTRHITIHTGLAARSLPFGFEREPPNVVHEFTETIVIGQPGHDPLDDIDPAAIIAIRIYGNHSGHVLPQGEDATFTYGPELRDFEEFRDANILIVNTRSDYRTFKTGLPYGVQVQPYTIEPGNADLFQTWRGYAEPSIGYIAALGHMINYWHYRRSDTRLEQIYLQGMTNAADPQEDLVKLGWSWILPPGLWMEGPEQDYTPRYDPAQKAYLVPRTGTGPAPFCFELIATYDEAARNGTMWLVNPAFILRDWNDVQTGVDVTLDGQPL